MSKKSISTHILNLDTGRPAAQVAVALYGPDSAQPIGQALTDSDGRIGEWDRAVELQAGEYRLEFSVGDWFSTQGRKSFYSTIQIAFHVDSTDEHYHVPLLLNAHGYSTYRGS